MSDISTQARGAVGELAGVAGGDELVVAAHGLELGEALQVGVGPVALVALQRDGALGDLLGLLVLDRMTVVMRHDLRHRSRPAFWPAAVRCWLISAYSSCFARLMP